MNLDQYTQIRLEAFAAERWSLGIVVFSSETIESVRHFPRTFSTKIKA